MPYSNVFYRGAYETPDDLTEHNYDLSKGRLDPTEKQLPPSDLPPSYHSIPPPYETAAEDSPPDYTNTDALATAVVPTSVFQPYEAAPLVSGYSVDKPLLDALHRIVLDWNASENIRAHKGKKSKQAEKKAQQAKWADSGDEADGDKKGEDEDHNGDGGAGGSAGAGGNGDGNGGGDDADDWDMGGGKKKKKKDKKGKKQEEDEEEEEEKHDDEGGDIGAAVTSNFWDEAGEAANPDDEWAMASAGKKGKKAKNKVVR